MEPNTPKKKWYKTKWFISTCIATTFVGALGLTIGLCYNAWYTTYDINSDNSGKLKVEFESATNNQNGQIIADSDGTKSITMTKNPLDNPQDKTNDLTNIQLHGLITNRPHGMWYPVYYLDAKGQTLVNNGFLDIYSNPHDLDHPLYNIRLLKDIENSDSTIPHEFDVTLKLDTKTISKHINLVGWTEWQNMPTGGIVNEGSSSLTINQSTTISTHLINQVSDITWWIRYSTGADATGQFQITDNLDGTYSFQYKASPAATIDVNIKGINNSLDSNVLTITLMV
jgi:uncharacterized protein YegP (UPF0339 family)